MGRWKKCYGRFAELYIQWKNETPCKTKVLDYSTWLVDKTIVSTPSTPPEYSEYSGTSVIASSQSLPQSENDDGFLYHSIKITIKYISQQVETK